MFGRIEVLHQSGLCCSKTGGIPVRKKVLRISALPFSLISGTASHVLAGESYPGPKAASIKTFDEWAIGCNFLRQISEHVASNLVASIAYCKLLRKSRPSGAVQADDSYQAAASGWQVSRMRKG